MHASESPAPAVDRHDALVRAHRWQVPADFNIAWACSRRWADDARSAGRVAVIHVREDGGRATLTYAQLQRRANALSRALLALGVARGDRVALVLPQGPETAVAHVALHQIGAVAMPLSILFGPEAMEYRLRDADAAVAIVEAGGAAALAAARAGCPALRTVIGVARGGASGAAVDGADRHWHELLADASDAALPPPPAGADDPAVLIYTSGTTGAPKGALIPHRALIGNLSGFVCSHNGGLGEGDVFWSPADWAWTGGLMDALLPTLSFGGTIVGLQGRFDPAGALSLMEREGVTHAFLFPTALKAMMKAVPRPRTVHPGLRLKAVMSAGEAVGDAVFDWCREALGVTVNEMFGQTEINYVVGNAHRDWPARAGSMGRAYPGHRVAVIDDDGRECPRGTPGDVAVHRRDIHGERDPVFFLGYWRNEAATRAKYTGDPDDSWCRTGDIAVMDEDGYLWYQGRADDVFKSAGYRIGPGEIENCLLRHPAVANAAVVPKPDAERGALVKAYVVLAPGAVGDAALVESLQQHVRARLAPYEYPKEIEFIDALPMTTTGKVQRRVLREREARRVVA